ncbi:MAG: hypothetical protein HN380_20435 [Victivallales bacterium]|nr:hypothetical protein [Victivallales bacterium]
MMVQIELPAAFTIGQVFALVPGNYLRKEERFYTHRLLGPFNVFMSCCYAPVGMFLLIGWPAWEVMCCTGCRAGEFAVLGKAQGDARAASQSLSLQKTTPAPPEPPIG